MSEGANLEWIWTLMSVVGQGYTLFNLRDALGDYRIVCKRQADARAEGDHHRARALEKNRRIALRNLRKEVGHLALFTVTLFVGVIALSTPDPIIASVSRLYDLIGYAFMAVIVLTAIHAAVDRRNRRELLDVMRRERSG